MWIHMVYLFSLDSSNKNKEQQYTQTHTHKQIRSGYICESTQIFDSDQKTYINIFKFYF